MARIEWDSLGERFYELGLDHGVLYPQDKTGIYPIGVCWNGLTEVNETPGGAEPNDLYADNIKYASLRSAETWSATISAYTYPDEFNDCNGSKKTVNGVYIGQQNRKGFGFCYRSLVGNDTASIEDDGYILNLCYGLTASPSEKGHETLNDSPDAITMSWEVSSIPVSVPGYNMNPTSTLTIKSLEADPEKLKMLEDILYGTDTTEPRLPLPAEVLDIFGYTGVDTGNTTIQRMAIGDPNDIDRTGIEDMY